MSDELESAWNAIPVQTDSSTPSGSAMSQLRSYLTARSIPFVTKRGLFYTEFTVDRRQRFEMRVTTDRLGIHLKLVCGFTTAPELQAGIKEMVIVIGRAFHQGTLGFDDHFGVLFSTQWLPRLDSKSHEMIFDAVLSEMKIHLQMALDSAKAITLRGISSLDAMIEWSRANYDKTVDLENQPFFTE